jgi:hypothetical protein
MCNIYRRPIPPREKLAATLRVLATGESLKSIHLQFRHGETTVQNYVPEVCQAIYHALKHEFMKVSVTLFFFNTVILSSFK